MLGAGCCLTQRPGAGAIMLQCTAKETMHHVLPMFPVQMELLLLHVNTLSCKLIKRITFMLPVQGRVWERVRHSETEKHGQTEGGMYC